jgi:hypothetical protein
MEMFMLFMFGAMMALAVFNWSVATLEQDDLKKISRTLEAVFFLLMAIIMQIVG